MQNYASNGNIKARTAPSQLMLTLCVATFPRNMPLINKQKVNYNNTW